MKLVYSPGQAARFLRVTARTVAKWFDEGRLKGYRVPGMLERRIPHQCLYDFMVANGLDASLLGYYERVFVGDYAAVASGDTDDADAAIDAASWVETLDHYAARRRRVAVVLAKGAAHLLDDVKAHPATRSVEVAP